MAMDTVNQLFAARAVPAHNDSGEEIPPHSYAKLDGTYTDTVPNAIKPDADSIAAALLLVTGAVAVPIGAPFAAVPAVAGMLEVEANSTAPGNGDDFGTVSGEWYGEKDKTGFKCNGVRGGRALTGPFSDGSGSRVTFAVTGVTMTENNFTNGTYYSAWTALTPNQNVVNILGSGGLILIWNRRLDFEASYVPAGAGVSRASIDAGGIELRYTDDSTSGLLALRTTSKAEHDAGCAGTVTAQSFENGISKDLAGGALADKTIKEYRLYMTLTKVNANNANASMVRGVGSGNLIFIGA